MPDYATTLTSHPAFTTLTEGLGRGFLLYFLPMLVLKRKVKKAVLRRALAVGGVCGTVRVVRYYTEGREEEQRECFSIANDRNNSTHVRLFALVKALLFKYPCHIAGILGALTSIGFDPSLKESQLLSIWMLVRAIRCVTPHIPFASTLTMCASAAQILSSYATSRKDLDPSYYRFLKIHGGLSNDALHTLGTQKNVQSLCKITHPGLTCKKFLFSYFLEEFRRALKVYAPLYVVFFLFSRSKSIPFLVQNTIRSTLFLSLYCSFAWGSGCAFHRVSDSYVSRKTLFMHTGVAGLATLIERSGRRSELAAYCVTYALDSILKTLTNTKRIPHLPLFVPTILCIALAILVRHRNQQPWIFSHFMLGDE